MGRRLRGIPHGLCRRLNGAQKGIGRELRQDGAEAGGDVAPGKGSWWPGRGEARITRAAQGSRARRGQMCCQCALWEQNSPAGP